MASQVTDSDPVSSVHLSKLFPDTPASGVLGQVQSALATVNQAVKDLTDENERFKVQYDSAVKEHEQKVQGLERECMESKASVEHLQSLLLQKDAEVKELKKNLAEAQSSLALAQGKDTQRDQEVNDLRNHLAEAQKRITFFEEEQDKQDKDAAKLRVQLQSALEENEKLRRQPSDSTQRWMEQFRREMKKQNCEGLMKLNSNLVKRVDERDERIRELEEEVEKLKAQKRTP